MICGDNPIRRLEDDALGRADVARAFAQQVLALDASEGVVVGVLGAWGSGKTSFVNLARAEFERAGVAILDFNPWMFSGAEQLVDSFFIELAAQLKMRTDLADVGKALEDYGETFSGMSWLPVVGPWIERGRAATNLISKILQRRKEGVGGRRAKLEKALTDLKKPVVVVVDDIDRLSTSEIRDIFKLVRLTASFSNIMYVLAFDRVRVETALGEVGVPGRDYLEKILQLVVDLPVIPTNVLNRQIFAALDEALADTENPGVLNDAVWPDVFMEVIRPLIRNMRDVRRYAVATRGTVKALGGQIALADALALEAVRVFLPDVFSHLHGAVDALTTTSNAGIRGDSPQLKAQIDRLVDTAKPQSEVVRAMIDRLFPAAERHIGGSHYGADWKGRWLRERRIAHEHILRFYLERVAGEGLQAFTAAEHVWAHLADRGALDRHLRSLEPNLLQDVIASLEVYEDQFAAEHVVPGTIVLLNLLPDLPERQRGMFDFGTALTVSRVTLRLIRSLKDPSAAEAAVRQILPELQCLSSKLELIDTVGHRKDVGHKLVSETAATELERAWRMEVRSASADQLAKEGDLLTVLLLTKRMADPSEDPLNISNSPQFTLALLRAAKSETLSQGLESRAVRRSPRLAWDALIQIYGDEATLRARVESIKEIKPEGAGDLLELADRYLAGWRPKGIES